MVENGKVVAVHYEGKLKSGEVFDNSKEREPLKFQVGSGQIIEGFEKAIIGKNVGDKVTIDINPKEAYGDIREDLIMEVDKSNMPGEVQVGQSLEAHDDNRKVNVIVKEIKENKVVIDANHPLAGKDLVFDIEVVEVESGNPKTDKK